MTQYGPPFSHRFETIRWITYLFLGAGLNAAILEIFGDYFLRLRGPFPGFNFWLFIIFPAVLIFLTPIALSLVFSRFVPDKQIVPPLYIQLISAAWFSAFIYLRWSADLLPVLVLELVYAWLGGTVQNIIAVWLLGLSTDRQNLIPYSLEIATTPHKVDEILSIDRFSNNLDILRSEEDTDSNTWEYIGGVKTQTSRYRMVIELSAGLTPDTSRLSLVFYERTSYYVSPVTDDLREYATAKISYLKSIFARSEYGFTVSESESEKADYLVSKTLGRMQGVLPQFGRLSKLGWFRVIAFVGAVSFALYEATALQNFGVAIELAGIILLYLAFELGTALKKER